MADRWLILAFYPHSRAAADAVKRYRVLRLGRVATISHAESGAVQVRSHGINRATVARYRPLVVSGETLVIAVPRPAHLEQVLAVLNQNAGSLPSTFTFHPSHTGGSPQLAEMTRVAPLTTEGLGPAATQLASLLRGAKPGNGRGRSLVRRLRDSEHDIKVVHQALTARARTDQPTSMSAVWLLDNGYILQEQTEEFRRNLPRRYYQALPVAPEGPHAGLPRVYSIASELITDTDLRVDCDRITTFLHAFQSDAPLTIGELWAIPLMLRLRLIESVRHLALEIERRECEREEADFWSNRLVTVSRQQPGLLSRFTAKLAEDKPQPSPYFADQITSDLYDEQVVLAPVQAWLESAIGSPLAAAVQQERLNQSTDQVALSHAITSLRKLAQIDWRPVFEQLSIVDAVLEQDAAGIYSHMDFATRDAYRHKVEEIAHRAKASEITVATHTRDLSLTGVDAVTRHVGYYLVDAGREALETRAGYRVTHSQRLCRWAKMWAGQLYLTIITLAALVLMAVGVAAAHAAGTSAAVILLLAIFAAVPALEMVVQAANFIVTRLLPARFLPRMSFEDGIPDEYRTLVVVPMMLLTPESIRKEVERLEIRYLANPNTNLVYGLLSDFSDAPNCDMPEDMERLDVVVNGIEQLNSKYGDGIFFLFHRKRTWSESEQSWIGWERKRGKLEQLNRYLVGEADPRDADLLRVGDPAQLSSIRFVMTLDSDTQLPRDTARRLVETLAHPLNEPRVSASRDRIERGYSIIQPTVRTSLPSATATRFTRIFADVTGTDPYMHTCSDLNQDMVDEGSYYGKGLYDLRTFHLLLAGRFPESHLLSHDLVEGVHIRVGLASDIQLLDLFPASYLAFARRRHRWVRGDWQVMDWMMATVPSGSGERTRNPLSLFNRWKIADNLRRSLLPVSELGLLLSAWFLSPIAGSVTLLVAVVLLLGPLGDLVARLSERARTERQVWWELATSVLRAGLYASLLPNEAGSTLDAITRVWYRRFVTHRKLLEWETAQVSQQAAANRQFRFVRRMIWVSLIAIGIWLAMLGPAPNSAVVAVPFITLWIVSPLAVLWLNMPAQPRPAADLSASDRQLLRQTARVTWRYFSNFVGPETNWLPPDNYQEALNGGVAQRTSPTNIGLSMLAALSANDFGYITLDEVCERTQSALNSLGKMQKFEGHLLNWYNIQTLEPLAPGYVSTVDSGNLLGCLWGLQEGLDEILSGPVLGPPAVSGLQDVLGLLHRSAGQDPTRAAACQKALEDLQAAMSAPEESLEGMVHWLRTVAPLVSALRTAVGTSTGPADAACYWAEQAELQVAAWNGLVDHYLSWVPILAAPPDGGLLALGSDGHEWRRQALSVLPSIRALATGDVTGLRPLVAMQRRAAEMSLTEPVSHWLDALAAAATEAQTFASSRVEQSEAASAGMLALGQAMNFRFLYDGERRLFYTGYNLADHRMDESRYDLLASEARLGSFIAIARGEAPLDHWWSLSRPYTNAYGERALLSWSGTMFEYLMPLILTRSFDNSMLDAACKAAVTAQMAYARRRNIPWGISEAAYSALDANQIYQYRAFGVPGLGIKRGLDEDLVVSPYATALALHVQPAAAVKNLRRMIRLGMRGPFGWYESMDYTRQQNPQGERGVIIGSYMAHHQGMILASVDNVVHGNVWQRRFHRNPSVRATESLLYERIPLQPALIKVGDARERLPRLAPISAPVEGHFGTPNTPTPRTILLSNGAYGVMVTNSGGGYSNWRGNAITRWRTDTTCDSSGAFCYLRDMDTGAVWSACFQPTRAVPHQYSVSFAAEKAEFRRRDSGIETITEIVVSPEDDVEVRRITLVNQTSRRRQIELTSYAEIALAPGNADRAHPAFSKLFVETEHIAAQDALLAWRRPRSVEDPQLWAFHVISDNGGFQPYMRHETDRARFLGRGRQAENPVEILTGLSNTVGACLDPIFSLQRRITLEPGQRASMALVTGAAGSREAAAALAEKYHDPNSAQRAMEIAWTHAQLDLRHLRIQQGEARIFQQLASHVLYPDALLRPSMQRLAENTLDQSGLWALGISGDLPIVVVTIADPEDIGVVRQTLTAHSYWMERGLQTDLVILNEEPGSYEMPLRNALENLTASYCTPPDSTGKLYVLQSGQMTAEARVLLLAAARVVLPAARGTLAQMLGMRGLVVPPPAELPIRPQVTEEASPPLPFMELAYFNGLGGFTLDGKEYAIYLGPGAVTPAPWINVMANPTFGSIVSESGSGFSWRENSQSNRITPWSNDPVSDPAGDAIYIRDEEMGVYWSPTPLPVREEDAYRVRHGQGYTLCEHNSHNIEQLLTTFVPMDEKGGAPLRAQRLHLHNHSARRRRLTVTFYCAWVLGTDRDATQTHVVTEWHADAGLLLARNHYNPEYGQRVAFLASNLPVRSATADRGSFIGRNGTLAAPAAMKRVALSGRFGAGLDPCGALQVQVDLDANQEADVVFLLGEASNADEALQIAEQYRSVDAVTESLQKTREWWDGVLGAVQVECPEMAANIMLNRWLLYQTLSCRLWGRSAFYQSGGAYGFRDQLQDVMALLYAAPQLARQHILLAASRQFEEGDVQHWWHPGSGAGVRTRVSDDLLWLPFVTAQYVRVTGDTAILNEPVTFLQGKPLEPGEQERFFAPAATEHEETLFDHCRRALVKGLTAGPHGLPLMGAGDWNDSLSRVGIGGKGESVWLAWFLIQVMNDFAGLLDLRGEAREAAEWRAKATTLGAAVDAQAWDGAWYRRAYFDDGAPLGSITCTQAQIDSIAQSWGVICGSAAPLRAAQAMQSVQQRLVRGDDSMVLLFTPPFDRPANDPGYIQGYPPGVRENGGQYTHGSLWTPLAFARMGNGDSAVELLRMMNPVEHAREPEATERYKVEPYAVVADIYDLAGSVGRGGWSWYTGAAGWMYRIWIEEVLGLKLRGSELTMSPCIAAAWDGFTVHYRYKATMYEIVVENPGHVCTGILNMELDGEPVPGNAVTLTDDGQNRRVRVVMGMSVPTGVESNTLIMPAEAVPEAAHRS